MQRCKYLKTDGYDVICTLNGSTLGDIMAYDGRKCDKCINRQNVKRGKGHVKKIKRKNRGV